VEDAFARHQPAHWGQARQVSMEQAEKWPKGWQGPREGSDPPATSCRPTSASGTRGGSASTVKLLDFGMARCSEGEQRKLTRLGHHRRTKQGYMAPEAGKRQTGRWARRSIQVWAALIYRMLTGNAPFQGIGRHWTKYFHLDKDAEPDHNRPVEWGCSRKKCQNSLMSLLSKRWRQEKRTATATRG